MTVESHLETLSCNSCGAPLQVPQSANYLKCNHCGQQLVVRRSESATFTEAIDRLTETTDSLSEQVEELSRQNRLAALDRHWEQDKESFMVSGKDGHRHLPNESGSLIGGIVIGVFGCIWTVMAIALLSGAPAVGAFSVAKFLFPAFGVLFVVFGVSASMRSYDKAAKYRAARLRYEDKRRQLLSEES